MSPLIPSASGSSAASGTMVSAPVLTAAPAEARVELADLPFEPPTGAVAAVR